MSEFWSKFKGVFVVEDPNAAKKTAEAAPATSQTTQQAAPQPQKAAVSTPSVNVTVGAGTVNEKFMQVLASALEGANQQGFDYFEFRQGIANLKNVPMDEATRYKSAFAMAQSMGITVDKLLGSAQHYLGVLKTEETKFLQAAENQKSAQVGNKTAEVENLEVQIRQKAEQIKKLTAEIDAHQKDIGKMKDDIAQATVKVQQTVNDFSATYQLLTQQIQNDVQQIQTYLK
jgi:hypothetical protein